MPLMNQLRTILEARGIQNSNQLKVAVQRATGKLLGQQTVLSAWNDPLWFPDGKTAAILCKAFQLQLSDFLIYLCDDDNEDGQQN